MEVINLKLDGLKLVKPEIFADGRGFFLESYNRNKLASQGIIEDFVQDNHSRSVCRTVRGMHFQKPSMAGPGQAKLVRVVRGSIIDVVVDIRKNSPTFGQWESVILNDENHWQLYVPIGFAHGFAVFNSEIADVVYKCSSVYNPDTEVGFKWDDPTIGIKWLFSGKPIVSQRDINAPLFNDMEW